VNLFLFSANSKKMNWLRKQTYLYFCILAGRMASDINNTISQLNKPKPTAVRNNKIAIAKQLTTDEQGALAMA
jgi:hypothetical protein